MAKNINLILIIGLILIYIPILGVSIGYSHILGVYINSISLIIGIIFVIWSVFIAIENS